MVHEDRALEAWGRVPTGRAPQLELGFLRVGHPRLGFQRLGLPELGFGLQAPPRQLLQTQSGAQRVLSTP